jgi:hypothetical protein
MNQNCIYNSYSDESLLFLFRKKKENNSINIKSFLNNLHFNKNKTVDRINICLTSSDFVDTLRTYGLNKTEKILKFLITIVILKILGNTISKNKIKNLIFTIKIYNIIQLYSGQSPVNDFKFFLNIFGKNFKNVKKNFFIEVFNSILDFKANDLSLRIFIIFFISFISYYRKKKKILFILKKFVLRNTRYHRSLSLSKSKYLRHSSDNKGNINCLINLEKKKQVTCYLVYFYSILKKSLRYSTNSVKIIQINTLKGLIIEKKIDDIKEVFKKILFIFSNNIHCKSILKYKDLSTGIDTKNRQALFYLEDESVITKQTCLSVFLNFFKSYFVIDSMTVHKMIFKTTLGFSELYFNEKKRFKAVLTKFYCSYSKNSLEDINFFWLLKNRDRDVLMHKTNVPDAVLYRTIKFFIFFDLYFSNSIYTVKLKYGGVENFTMICRKSCFNSKIILNLRKKARKFLSKIKCNDAVISENDKVSYKSFTVLFYSTIFTSFFKQFFYSDDKIDGMKNFLLTLFSKARFISKYKFYTTSSSRNKFTMRKKTCEYFYRIFFLEITLESNLLEISPIYYNFKDSMKNYFTLKKKMEFNFFKKLLNDLDKKLDLGDQRISSETSLIYQKAFLNQKKKNRLVEKIKKLR